MTTLVSWYGGKRKSQQQEQQQENEGAADDIANHCEQVPQQQNIQGVGEDDRKGVVQDEDGYNSGNEEERKKEEREEEEEEEEEERKEGDDNDKGDDAEESKQGERGLRRRISRSLGTALSRLALSSAVTESSLPRRNEQFASSREFLSCIYVDTQEEKDGLDDSQLFQDDKKEDEEQPTEGQVLQRVAEIDGPDSEELPWWSRARAEQHLEQGPPVEDDGGRSTDMKGVFRRVVQKLDRTQSWVENKREHIHEKLRLALHWVAFFVYAVGTVVSLFYLSETYYLSVYTDYPESCDDNYAGLIVIMAYVVCVVVILPPAAAICLKRWPWVAPKANGNKWGLWASVSKVELGLLVFTLVFTMVTSIVVGVSAAAACEDGQYDDEGNGGYSPAVFLGHFVVALGVITGMATIPWVIITFKFARGVHVTVRNRDPPRGVRELYVYFTENHACLMLMTFYGAMANTSEAVQYEAPECNEGQLCDDGDPEEAVGVIVFAIILSLASAVLETFDLFLWSNGVHFSAKVLCVAASNDLAAGMSNSPTSAQTVTLTPTEEGGMAPGDVSVGIKCCGRSSCCIRGLLTKYKMQKLAVLHASRLSCEHRVAITDGGTISIKFFSRISCISADIAVSLALIAFTFKIHNLIYAVIQLLMAVWELSQTMSEWCGALARRNDVVVAAAATTAAAAADGLEGLGGDGGSITYEMGTRARYLTYGNRSLGHASSSS